MFARSITIIAAWEYPTHDNYQEYRVGLQADPYSMDGQWRVGRISVPQCEDSNVRVHIYDEDDNLRVSLPYANTALELEGGA